MGKGDRRWTEADLPIFEPGTIRYWVSPSRIRGVSPKTLAILFAGVILGFFGIEKIYSARPRIAVSAPPGYCALDPAVPAEASMLSAAAAQLADANKALEARQSRDSSGLSEIEMLAVYADCRALTEGRDGAGQVLPRVMTVLATRIVYKDFPVDVGRQEFLDEWTGTFAAAAGTILLKDTLEVTGSLLLGREFNAAGIDLPAGGRHSRSDELAIYGGQEVWVTGGRESDFAVAAGITVVNGVIVVQAAAGNGLEAFDLLETGHAAVLDDLFSDLRAAIGETIRLNGGNAGP